MILPRTWLASKSLHHANQQCGLCIGFGSALLPVLERPHIGAQAAGEEAA
jgi:hypothetical protein